MTTMDYRAIPSDQLPKEPVAGLEADSRADAPAAENNAGGVLSRIQSAASGVMESVKSRMGDLPNVYLQPLDPSEDISLSDRASLILQSMRSWGDFFNLREFNLPPPQQVTSRVGHNIETYFYNYFFLTGLHLIFFTLFHFGCVLWFAVWLGLMYLLYVRNEGDIEIRGVKIDANIKLGIAVVTALLALTFGHVFSMVVSLFVFSLIVVGIHGIVRDDAPSSVEDIAI